MQNKSHFYLSIFFLFFSRLLFGQTSEKEILWTAEWSPNGKLVANGGNVGALNIYGAKTIKIEKFSIRLYPITKNYVLDKRIYTFYKILTWFYQK
jgi:hypothetical protein